MDPHPNTPASFLRAAAAFFFMRFFCDLDKPPCASPWSRHHVAQDLADDFFVHHISQQHVVQYLAVFLGTSRSVLNLRLDGVDILTIGWCHGCDSCDDTVFADDRQFAASIYENILCVKVVPKS